MKHAQDLPPINQDVPPIAFPPAPFFTRYSPAGPATPQITAAGGARVISVPGRYTVTQIVDAPEGLALCDVGSAADVPMLEAVARWLDKPVLYLIPTHLHFDHVMGITAAAQRLGAQVALGGLQHELVESGRRPRPPVFRTLKHFFIPWLWQGLPFLAREDDPRGFGYGFPWSRNDFSPRGPVLADGAPVPRLDGWETIATPGHTDEGICLYHRGAGFLVAGDTVRNYLGGEWNPIITDHEAYYRTIDRLKQLHVQAIFPGHGPVLHDHHVIQTLRPF